MLPHHSHMIREALMGYTKTRRAVGLPLLLLLLAACADRADTPDMQRTTLPTTGPQAEFWAALQQLCGNAYEGTVADAPADDTTFTDRYLVMHVRYCSPNVVRIPFHVGDDRSRTWVLTLLEDGIRLKHDHRHEDGTDDEITLYGGDTEDPGTAERQQFPADEFTAALVPAAATNVWTIEVVPGQQFVYALERMGTDRRFRIEFDLTRQVVEPPPPWGATD
jgi:hypothetical protein